LILPLVAQVDDDARGAPVQRVEVVSVLSLQAAVGEVVDAPQAVQQFPAIKQLIKHH